MKNIVHSKENNNTIEVEGVPILQDKFYDWIEQQPMEAIMPKLNGIFLNSELNWIQDIIYRQTLSYDQSLSIHLLDKNYPDYPIWELKRHKAQNIIKYLDSLLSNKEQLETKPKTLSTQKTEKETEQQTPTFKNNFDNVSPFEIHKHFKAGLVDKKYLTLQELNEYLKAAFEFKKIPKTLFKIKDAPTRTAIEAVFYTYYKNVSGKIHGKQNQYAALLGDYFEGYKTKTVSSNFSKSVY